MIRIREAAVAGSFYPADAAELREAVRQMVDTVGGMDRVVGYGAWMFVEDEPCAAAA